MNPAKEPDEQAFRDEQARWMREARRLLAEAERAADKVEARRLLREAERLAGRRHVPRRPNDDRRSS